MKRLATIFCLLTTTLYAEEVRINIVSECEPEYIQIGTTDRITGAYWAKTHVNTPVSKPAQYNLDTLITSTPQIIDITTPENSTEGYIINILKTYTKYYQK